MVGSANLINHTEDADRIALPKEYFRPSEAARYVGVSESTLAKLRMQGKRADGPKFAKINGCVIYRRTDLDAWIDSCFVENRN